MLKRPVVVKTTRRPVAKAALDARQSAAQAWAEEVVGQVMQDLEGKGFTATVDRLRALVRVIGQQIGRLATPTLAGCVLFGEGARLAPGWQPDPQQAGALAERVFGKEAA